MLLEESSINERLDHLGIVAGVCQEIGLASWLDAQEPGNRKPGECGNGDGGNGAQWVRLQQLAVVLGAAVLRRASPLSICWARESRRRCSTMIDEARMLDWLYAHDLTKLFAGIASQARRIFGIKAEQVHVDTT